MAFDKVTHLIFRLSFLCFLLAFMASTAHANDSVSTETPILTSALTTKPAAPLSSSIKPSSIQEVIQKQFQAINTRDADLIWTYTTDDFHQKFDSGKEFLSHLRFHLRPLYNHQDYKFLDQHPVANGFIQKVEIQTADQDDPVIAIYRMKKQDNGQWLIDSFVILENESSPL